MFGFFKSPGNKVSKQNSVDPPSSGTNPFDSDTESNTKSTIKPSRRANSEPVLIVPSLGSNPFDDDDNGRKGTSSATSSYSNSSTTQDKYRNDFRESGGLENQSMQELENYAVYKAEETTSTVKNCLNIAEDIRGDATRTLDMLHHQGEQIRRTHDVVANTDKDLSKGEKILGNLGGMFSKTWKPKKTYEISGPVVTIGFLGNCLVVVSLFAWPKRKNSSKRSDKKQREKLGLAPVPKGKGTSCTPPPEPTNALQKVEVEKAKQDDALSDLSNVLGELKNMAVDMGGELNRQNKALDHLGDDVDELNSRVKGANQRTRRLLGK